ncbi:MAG: type III-B CRISPR-associated protein Cas10/Cmr2 [Desulfobacca sp. 4484_104]|nr:MAG: type III-B CRISPR-associated protein Cas10/Cmr2 [Desulfobacca sp. 4484_104]
MTNWPLKIAAFLHRLPYFALYPAEAPAYRQNVLAALLGDTGSINQTQVEKAAALAAGLDIPPFVRDLPEGCWRQQPCLTHPLSGQVLELTLPDPLPEAEVLHKVVLRVIENLQTHGFDSERLFLALWRLLPDKLADADQTGLGTLWTCLPADPRIPSHSIWEQASVAAAIAGTGGDPALLLFTIASAQKAVSVARRTQDAWMGSFLLSYLSWQAIKAVAEVCGPDAIVSPSLREQPLVDYWLVKEKGLEAAGLSKPPQEALEIGSIPNIFAAIVPAGQAPELAKQASRAVADGWQQVTTKVRDQVIAAIQKGWGVADAALNDIWGRQAAQFIEGLGIFWVTCPWGDDPQAILKAVRPDLKSDVVNNFEKFLKNLKDKGYKTHVGQTYHLLSGLTGRALTARKNLRQFAQVEEPGHKCSLCGDWEALHPPWNTSASITQVANRIRNPEIKANPHEERYSYRWLRAFWEALGELERSSGQKLLGRIRKGESLCSVCLTRRLALEVFFKEELDLTEHHLFPSTAGIATAAWRGQLLEEAAKPGNSTLVTALQTYIKDVTDFVKKLNLPYPAAVGCYLKQRGVKVAQGNEFLLLDGDWLYPESYDKKALEQAYGLKNPDGRKKCQDAAQTLLAKAKKCCGLGRPPGYYAILALDGDKMGDWVTGALAPQFRWLLHPDVRDLQKAKNLLPLSTYQRPLGAALQVALSDSLKNFALYGARSIVEQDYAGKLIYAGGDDVLAFLPLEHLLPVMQRLYQMFRGLPKGYQEVNARWRRLLGGIRPVQPGEEQHEGMTISMGVVIAHHSYPLYHALELAPQVLKKTAKQKLGRDAWAVRLLRRSGESTEVGLPFAYELQSKACRSLKALEGIMQLLAEDKLSSRLPYRLAEHRWARGLTGPVNLQFDLVQAQALELGRLARQHSQTGWERQVAKVLHDIWTLLCNLKKSTKNKSELQQLDIWEVLTQLLLLGRFLAGRESNGVAQN